MQRAQTFSDRRVAEQWLAALDGIHGVRLERAATQIVRIQRRIKHPPRFGLPLRQIGHDHQQPRGGRRAEARAAPLRRQVELGGRINRIGHHGGRSRECFGQLRGGTPSPGLQQRAARGRDPGKAGKQRQAPGRPLGQVLQGAPGGCRGAFGQARFKPGQ